MVVYDLTIILDLVRRYNQDLNSLVQQSLSGFLELYPYASNGEILDIYRNFSYSPFDLIEYNLPIIKEERKNEN